MAKLVMGYWRDSKNDTFETQSFTIYFKFWLQISLQKEKQVSINFFMLLREISGGFQIVSDRKLKLFAVHN